MSASEITGLTELAAAPADDDELVIVDVSDTTQSANGSTKRLAASRVARTGAANTFTTAQVFGSGATGGQVAIKASDASTVGLVVDTAASPSTSAMQIKNNGDNAITFSSKIRQIATTPFDNGTSTGGFILLERNDNASTPAAGFLRIIDKSDTAYNVWPDDSGALRIGTSYPTNANDTSGTVVGTQTSTRAAKDIIGEGVAPEDALATILSTPIYEFQYKSGAYNNSVFHGIVAEDSPDFAMDAGRVFNPVSAFGYTVQAIKALMQRIEQLEAQL